TTLEGEQGRTDAERVEHQSIGLSDSMETPEEREGERSSETVGAREWSVTRHNYLPVERKRLRKNKWVPFGVRPEAEPALVDIHIPMIPASFGRGPSRTGKTSYSLGWLASADMLEEHHWIESILVTRSLYAGLGS
ncbi:hypothetical protein BHM03_00062971, partial [Ensete ventricosum]